MLTKVRATIAKHINQSAYTIIEYRLPLIDNGYGKMIPDLTKDLVAVTLGIARISRRRLPEPIIANAKTTYDYQDVYYLIAEYTATWLRTGIIFEYHDQRFRTLLPENKYINNEIAYKICDLEQTTQHDVNNMYAAAPPPIVEP